ncbi:hypothetical protein [Pseudomonas putida]|uniref:hypothetical protein n=1 Tax=Pseudomonas putida TaxID=303 RepID=UPI0023635565|nr:hypothetical protein [Pseudomonas putida]MDD2005607.1 hypothetical protein [Pseudomonas putida]
MGMKLTAKGTLAPWNHKLIPPVTRGLQAWFTFDTDAARFGFNRAMDKPDAEVIGTPTAFATHGRFKGLVNFLKTQIPDSAEMTILVVGKAVNAPPVAGGGGPDSPFYAGGFSGNSVDPTAPGAGYGVSLFHGAPTSVTGNAGRLNTAGTGPTSGSAILEGEVATSWGLRAVRCSANLTQTFNLTRNVVLSGTVTTRRVLSDSVIRIGGAASVFGGEVDISAVAIYSVALSDAEMALVYNAMRKRMSRLGIAI